MPRSSLSVRRERFCRLVRAAYYMDTADLEAMLLDPRLTCTSHVADLSRLSRLAALRILACRVKSGRPYLERKRLVREHMRARLAGAPSR